MPLTPSETADRYRGALLGFAVGDALGFPLRGLPPGNVARLSALTEDFAPKPRGQFAKGQFTDDTQMALATLESLAADGRMEGRSVAAHISWLWKEGVILQPPTALTDAVSRLLRGVPWMSAGAPLGVVDPSSLSRALVLGLWHGEDVAKLARDVGTACVVTHKDPLCAAAASAFGRAVALAAGEDALTPQSFCHELASAASVHDARLPEELRQLPRLLSWDEERALAVLRTVGVPQSQLQESEGLPAHVVPVVLIALYAALKAPHDFKSAMTLVLRCGGEVDVAAALCGGILGARLGAEGIPARLRKNVMYGEHLISSAERLLATRQKGLLATVRTSRGGQAAI